MLEAAFQEVHLFLQVHVFIQISKDKDSDGNMYEILRSVRCKLEKKKNTSKKNNHT